VSLFFVLSGFLITRILVNIRLNKSYYFTFFARRALRIFPLYYLSLFLWFVLLPLLDAKHTPEQESLWWFVFYLQNIPPTFGINIGEPGHLWSLAVEEHYYLIWPILVRNMHWINMQMLILSGIILAILTKVILCANGFTPFYFTITNIDALLVGSWIALNEEKIRNSPTIGLRLKLAFLASIGPFAYLWFGFSGSSATWLQVLKGTMIASIYGLILMLVLAKNGLPKVAMLMLESKALVLTGLISYGLYIYHPSCYYYGLTIFNTGSVGFDALLSICLAYFLATLSYNWFEKKFLRLKQLI
jgi:peptidoglycan/LPS O-acetylase OafA/YrhL